MILYTQVLYESVTVDSKNSVFNISFSHLCRFFWLFDLVFLLITRFVTLQWLWMTSLRRITSSSHSQPTYQRLSLSISAHLLFSQDHVLSPAACALNLSKCLAYCIISNKAVVLRRKILWSGWRNLSSLTICATFIRRANRSHVILH